MKNLNNECRISIIDESQISVNKFGHEVYDFYPNRKFIGNVVIGYWRLEIAYIEEVVELFWLFDSLDIKVTVLGSKNQLPMWSLYSHEMISIDEGYSVMRLGKKYVHGKDVYYNADLVDLCPGYSLPNGIRWISPGIQFYRERIKNLTEGKWADVYDIDECDWFLFRSKKMHEFYHNRVPNVWILSDAYDGYERVVNHFEFDESPKLDMEFKWAKSRGSYPSERHQSITVHNVVRSLIKDGYEDKIFNYDLKAVDNSANKTGFPFTRKILELSNGTISTTSILLSLNNGFAYASQAGASSYFYLMPTNMLWAEHQYWYHIWKSGTYFKDRWLQKLYKNDTEFFSTLRPRSALGRPRRDKETGVPVGVEAKQEVLENERCVREMFTEDYFYNKFYTYLCGK